VDFDERPQKKVVVRCDGPDGGYIATAGCILSCAFTIMKDRPNMPRQGFDILFICKN